MIGRSSSSARPAQATRNSWLQRWGADGATSTPTRLVLGWRVAATSLTRPRYSIAVLQAYEDVGVRALVGFAMMDRRLAGARPSATRPAPKRGDPVAA